ncbi:MAG TPA: pilus assembly protein TadG-related protein [Gryllotalpicola sp.]
MIRPGREDGSILPLIFGFFALALALIVVVTAATALYLERSRLYTLADGAALAGAGSFAFEATQLDPAGEAEPHLDDAAVEAAASDYLRRATAGRSTPVALVSAGAPDGRSANVRLAEDWRPPIVSVFTPRGIRIEVGGDARTVFW